MVCAEGPAGSICAWQQQKNVILVLLLQIWGFKLC
jgi:hypothetical protein